MSTRHGSTKDSAAVLAVSSSLREKGYDQCLRRNFNKRRADRNKNRIVNCILVLKYLSLFYVSFYSGRAIAVLKRAIFAPDIHSSVREETAFRLKRIFAKVHLHELYDAALPRLLGQDLVLYGFYATVIPTFLQSRTKYRLFR